MKIAHLIMTYTSPQQTGRMIKIMQHPEFDFYIHVDKKIDITPYLYLTELPNVYMIHNRLQIKWAGYDTVLATFNCIKEICNKKIDYAYINFLSGQDYPIKTAQYIVSFFEKNRGKEFAAYKDYINYWPEGLKRVKQYSLANYNFKGKHFIEKIINGILAGRKIPKSYHPYGDSMFWMLSPECALYVVNTVEKDKKLRNFFRFTWGSDEFVFQTILMNSVYKKRIINNNYRYIDWSAGGSHPKLLRVEDFDKLKSSENLFARKFNQQIDAKILDLIDLHLIKSLWLIFYL